MIVVDASALIAIAAREPGFEALLTVLLSADEAVIAPANYVEAGVILVRRGFVDNRSGYDHWLARLGVTLDDHASMGEAALSAYLAFGKGIHPAGLNLGDVFAYALAKSLDAPLLYKGDDFVRTDIRSALQPT